MDGESSRGTDEGFRGRRTWSRTCLADMAPETIAPGINRWARHDRDRRGGVRRRPEAVVRFSPNCSICLGKCYLESVNSTFRKRVLPTRP